MFNVGDKVFVAFPPEYYSEGRYSLSSLDRLGGVAGVVDKFIFDAVRIKYTYVTLKSMLTNTTGCFREEELIKVAEQLLL